jgi:hypothetical protein
MGESDAKQKEYPSERSSALSVLEIPPIRQVWVHCEERGLKTDQHKKKAEMTPNQMGNPRQHLGAGEIVGAEPLG